MRSSLLKALLEEGLKRSAPEIASEEEADAAAPDSPRKLRVLVAEDNTINRRVVRGGPTRK